MASSNKKELLSEFIETYHSLPELWDIQCPAYSNRIKKAAAYDILIEKLKPIDGTATRDSVVKKINNLRSTFRKELKKSSDSKRSGASADEIYIPTLWYFDELRFLVDQETPEPGDSTLSEEGGEKSDIDDLTGMNDFLNALMSLQLPFALIPAVTFSSSMALMGDFVNGLVMMVVALILAAVIIGINLIFVVSSLITVLTGAWWQYFLVAVVSLFYTSLIVYLVLFLLSTLGWSRISDMLNIKNNKSSRSISIESVKDNQTH